MKRTGMMTVGFFLGLAFMVATVFLFVHRPPECGEPAACGDDYLFPALPIGLALWLIMFIYAFIIARQEEAKWDAFFRKIGFLAILFCTGISGASFLLK